MKFCRWVKYGNALARAVAAIEPMSSAKLQVRPILLKKISFMIFFNNYPSDYETIRCHRKEKIKKRFFLF